MQPKQQSNWHWWLVLLLGAWLAAGQPGVDVLPIGGRAPFAADKLSVVVVRESSANHTQAQLTVINGTDWRGYVIAHKGEFRVVDPDSPLDREQGWVKAAMAVKRDSLPWLLMSNGSDGYSGPLPADSAAMMALIEKYGG